MHSPNESSVFKWATVAVIAAGALLATGAASARGSWSVQIGTRVAHIGRSSVKLEQAIFQNGRCAATSQSVIVQIDVATRQSAAITDSARARLAALVVTPAGAETE